MLTAIDMYTAARTSFLSMQTHAEMTRLPLPAGGVDDPVTDPGERSRCPSCCWALLPMGGARVTGLMKQSEKMIFFPRCLSGLRCWFKLHHMHKIKKRN